MYQMAGKERDDSHLIDLTKLAHLIPEWQEIRSK